MKGEINPIKPAHIQDEYAASSVAIAAASLWQQRRYDSWRGEQSRSQPLEDFCWQLVYDLLAVAVISFEILVTVRLACKRDIFTLCLEGKRLILHALDDVKYFEPKTEKHLTFAIRSKNQCST